MTVKLHGVRVLFVEVHKNRTQLYVCERACGHRVKVSITLVPFVAKSWCRECGDAWTSKPHLITVEGVTHSMAEWARLLGVNRSTIAMRRRSGWSWKRAVTTPLGATRKGRPVREHRPESRFNPERVKGRKTRRRRA